LSRKTTRVLAAAVAATVVAAAAGIIAGRLSSDKSGTSATPIAQGYSSQIPLPFADVHIATGVAVDAAGGTYVTGSASTEDHDPFPHTAHSPHEGHGHKASNELPEPHKPEPAAMVDKTLREWVFKRRG
jgi:hypothetical protein